MGWKSLFSCCNWPSGKAGWELLSCCQGYLALLTIPVSTIWPNSPSAPPVGPSQAPAANLLFQATLTLPCPMLTYLSSSIQHLVSPNHALANSSHSPQLPAALYYISKEEDWAGLGIKTMHGRSQSASESFNAWRLGLEMVPLEANSSCFFLGQGEFAGMLLCGMVVFKYRVGTLAQTLRQMINPADLHKY